MNNYKPSVLIADTDKLSITGLKNGLLREGFNVVSVVNSEQALDFAVNNRIDFAIMDADNRDINGCKLATLIQHLQRDSQIIMTTANNSFEIMLKCTNPESYPFFLKPIDNLKIIDWLKNSTYFDNGFLSS